jgi:hypothetical protein
MGSDHFQMVEKPALFSLSSLHAKTKEKISYKT